MRCFGNVYVVYYYLSPGIQTSVPAKKGHLDDLGISQIR
jgi:hypothetical protein